jgi:hypothetical protein
LRRHQARKRRAWPGACLIPDNEAETQMMRMQAPLDWLNFFLADVKDGLGPFLAIYLLSSQHWDAGKIGVVMMIAGVATVTARAPFGRSSTGRDGSAD